MEGERIGEDTSDLDCPAIDEVRGPFQDRRWKLELQKLCTRSINYINYINGLLDIRAARRDAKPQWNLSWRCDDRNNLIICVNSKVETKEFWVGGGYVEASPVLGLLSGQQKYSVLVLT